MGSGPSKIELAEEELRVAKLEIEKLKQEEEERLDKERVKAEGEARVKQLVETAKLMVEEDKRRKIVEGFIRAVLEEEVETLLDRLAAEEEEKRRAEEARLEAERVEKERIRLQKLEEERVEKERIRLLSEAKAKAKREAEEEAARLKAEEKERKIQLENWVRMLLEWEVEEILERIEEEEVVKELRQRRRAMERALKKRNSWGREAGQKYALGERTVTAFLGKEEGPVMCEPIEELVLIRKKSAKGERKRVAKKSSESEKAFRETYAIALSPSMPSSPHKKPSKPPNEFWLPVGIVYVELEGFMLSEHAIIRLF